MEFSKVDTISIYDLSGKVIRKDSLPSRYSLYEDFTKDFFKNPVLVEKFDSNVLKDPSALSAIPGKPCWGTCLDCYLDKCPMFIGKVKDQAYTFFYCPDCQKYFKVVELN